MNKTINHYFCESCELLWQDIWECECNDDCTHCGIETEPYVGESEAI